MQAAAKLAPVAAPPLPTAADKLPTAMLKLPSGFHIEVYASGIGNARSLRMGDKGTVFVGTRFGNKVTAIVKKDGKTELKTVASGLYRPNGLAYHNGTLYIAELSQISKIDNVENVLDNPPKPTVIYKDLPKDEAHGWKFIAIGPDNKLYIPVGQPGNNVLHDEDHGQIRRINLDGTGRENVALGVRNSVGFDWNPVNHQLYFSDNGRDWMSEDVPQDELNRVTKVGEDFGAPYCYQGNLPDPEFGWGHSCSDFTPPIALTGPHSAGLGLRFYTGDMFPKKYKNAIFLARHGSWNRSKKFGGDIIVYHLNKNGTVKSSEVFLTGFLAGQQICRASGGRRNHEGRIDARFRRLERRGLSHHLRQGAHRQPLTGTRTAGGNGPRLFIEITHADIDVTRHLLAAAALIFAAGHALAAETIAERAAPCLACHGANGQSENPEIPSLGGQTAPYVLIQLIVSRKAARRRGHERHDQEFPDDDLRAFSDLFPSCRRRSRRLMPARLRACSAARR